MTYIIGKAKYMSLARRNDERDAISTNIDRITLSIWYASLYDLEGREVYHPLGGKNASRWVKLPKWVVNHLEKGLIVRIDKVILTNFSIEEGKYKAQIKLIGECLSEESTKYVKSLIEERENARQAEIRAKMAYRDAHPELWNTFNGDADELWVGE